MTDTSFTTLNYRAISGIARIELDKPPLNLIDEESALEYYRALKKADADESVQLVILSGAGEGMSAGVDLKYLMQFEKRG